MKEQAPADKPVAPVWAAAAKEAVKHDPVVVLRPVMKQPAIWPFRHR